MHRPSSRILINRVDIYPAIQAQDADGAPQFLYAQTPAYAAVPCTVQLDGFEEIIDDQQRVTRQHSYRIMFGSYIARMARSKVVWIDNGGVTRTLFSEAVRDEAGRGAAFTLKATEKL